MADFFMDTDGGSDGNSGTTWPGKLTFEGLLAVMSAGDRGWIQGASADTAAANRTLTSSPNILAARDFALSVAWHRGSIRWLMRARSTPTQ